MRALPGDRREGRAASGVTAVAGPFGVTARTEGSGDLHEESGRNFVSCMPTNIYGEGDNFD
ncbi:hypothetical protein ACWD48_32070, partial [Streptomyces sp. NPDC002519]